MKAALSRAAGYIAHNEFENEARTCIECGAPLESWQASRCQACIDKSLTGVVVANSAEWRAADALARINAHADAARARNLANAAQVAEWEADDDLSDVGQGDDYAPNFWDADGKLIDKIEKILSDTQNRRGRLHPAYFLDCSDLCYIGK